MSRLRVLLLLILLLPKVPPPMASAQVPPDSESATPLALTAKGPVSSADSNAIVLAREGSPPVAEGAARLPRTSAGSRSDPSIVSSPEGAALGLAEGEAGTLGLVGGNFPISSFSDPVSTAASLDGSHAASRPGQHP